MMRIVITLLFFLFTITDILAQNQASSFDEAITLYNQDAGDVRKCFNRFTNPSDKTIIKKIIEGEKVSSIPSIEANKKSYQITDNNVSVQFDNQLYKTRQFVFKGFRLKLPAQYNTQTIKANIEKIESNPSLSNLATLYISCFFNILNETTTVTIPNPIEEKIIEYNQNAHNPKYFSDKIPDSSDKKVYEELLSQNKTGTLPYIEKKGNLYQMKHNGVTLEFDQEMIKQGKVRINNKIIDLSSATNAQEITDLIHRAFNK